jgi:hypothetical protein
VPLPGAPTVGVLLLPVVNFSDCVSGLGRLCKWGTQDLYWFKPPESNTLRSVHAALLFTLICSRGYKWAIEGAWSQVSVVCISHGRLEVEEESESLHLP